MSADLRPASRLLGLGLSPIRGMSLGAPADAVSLGLGEPTWELPAVAAEALARDNCDCAYGPNAGLPELREAVAAYQGTSADRVMVTAGSQGTLFALFQAWAGPGSQALVPDPGFLAYPALARLAGATPVPYRLGPGGRLDAELFSSALDRAPAAALAVVNHPGNPSGGGADPAALARVSDACRDRGVLLISDEVYRELYLGERPCGLADASDYGVTLSSVSKAWGGPGLRLGWAVGDPRVLEPARLVHNYMTTAAARPSQRAALALLKTSDVVLPAARLALKERWEAFSGALEKELGLSPEPPAGSFYYWMRLPEDAIADPMAFCLRVRDQGRVIVIPGLAFGEAGRPYARLSWAGPPDALKEGVRRLAPFCGA